SSSLSGYVDRRRAPQSLLWDHRGSPGASPAARGAGMTPRISVIVTTCRRPVLLVRAVRSALSQTQSEIEVIVVVDGPHAETEAALAPIEDERLRICVRSENGGQPAAINTGVAIARGEWIALLDDDDHWFPSKLERQLRAAEASAYRHPIVSCRFI